MGQVYKNLAFFYIISITNNKRGYNMSFLENLASSSARLKSDVEFLQKQIAYKTSGAKVIDLYLEAREQREDLMNLVMWRIKMQEAIAEAKKTLEFGKKLYGENLHLPSLIQSLIEYEPKFKRTLERYPEAYFEPEELAAPEDQFHSAAIGPGNDDVTPVVDENHTESVAVMPERKNRADTHVWTEEEIGHLLHGDHEYLMKRIGLTYDQLGWKTRELGYVFRINTPVNKPKVYNRLVIGCHPDWLEMIKNGNVDELIDVQKIRPSAIANVAKKNGFDIPERCLAQ